MNVAKKDSLFRTLIRVPDLSREYDSMMTMEDGHTVPGDTDDLIKTEGCMDLHRLYCMSNGSYTPPTLLRLF